MVTTSAPEDPYHSPKSRTASFLPRSSSLSLPFSRIAWFFLLTSLLLITRLQLNPRIMAPEAYLFTLSLTGFAIAFWAFSRSGKRPHHFAWKITGWFTGSISLVILLHSLLSF